MPSSTRCLNGPICTSLIRLSSITVDRTTIGSSRWMFLTIRAGLCFRAEFSVVSASRRFSRSVSSSMVVSRSITIGLSTLSRVSSPAPNANRSDWMTSPRVRATGPLR